MKLREVSIIWLLVMCYLHLAISAPRTLTIRQVPPQQGLPPGLQGFPPRNFASQPVQGENPSFVGQIGGAPQPQPIQNERFPNFANPQQQLNSFQPQVQPGLSTFPQQQAFPQQQQLPPQMIPQQLPLQPQIPQQQLPQQQFLPQSPQSVPLNAQGQQFIPVQLASEPPPAPITTQAPPVTPKIVPLPVDKNVDLDGDGALSLTEVQYAAFVHHGLSSSVVENLFNQVDHNHDGYLTSIEFNDIRPLVLAKAENAAQRYLQSVDIDKNGLLSLSEAQAYILKEYGISNRDVERIWRLVVPSSSDEMDAVLFSKLRRRIRGMSIRLARQIMKTADKNEDGHIDLKEAQMIAFEQEGISAGDVVEMLASVDDNNDNELNAPEFADFERIVRSRSIETSSKALKVVDTDGSGTLTMDEAKNIAFDHYGFDERTLEPFFAQADENEDGSLDAVEFAGFRSVIRARAVKNAGAILPEVDVDNDGVISSLEAEEKARREDDMEPKETFNLYSVADQDKSGTLDKVELADFVRLVRLSAIKYASDHFREFDLNHDRKVTVEELQRIIEDKYQVGPEITREFFDKVDVDTSSDLSPGEIVDFRHEIRKHVAERSVKAEIDVQNKKDMVEIEEKLRREAEEREKVQQQSEQPKEKPIKGGLEAPRRHPVNSKPNIQKDGEGQPISSESAKAGVAVEEDAEKQKASHEDSYEVEEEQSVQKPEENESPKISKEARASKEKSEMENQGDEVAKNDREDIEEKATSQTESEAIETTQLPESIEAEETSSTVESLTTQPQPTTVKHRRRKIKKVTEPTYQTEETVETTTTTEIPSTEAPTTLETTTPEEINEVEEEPEEESVEEEPETTPSTTTTTEKPKKRRRLRKKTTTTAQPTTTTTIAQPVEYEEEYEADEDPHDSEKASVRKR